MHVSLIQHVDQLESLATAWRGLAAAQPFVGPDWLIPWWRHVGSRPQPNSAHASLYVLAVHDQRGQLAAVAPWYREHSRWQGRTLRFLGSGSVCTDYQSLACRPGAEQSAVAAMAAWLTKHAGAAVGGWDLLALDAVDLTDPNILTLRDALARGGAISATRPAGNCWRIDLPTRHESYLQALAKPHRRRARRIQRHWLQTGRARLHRATTPDELAAGFDILVQLHTRRWQQRGQAGIFAEPGIHPFHAEATRRLLAAGQLRLTWLEIDGRPAASEYCLAGGDTLYCYQSGIDPSLAQEPGNVVTVALVQEAIADGYAAFDFLRGDEPYKRRWGAVPRPIHDLRILPGNLPGYLRHSLWQAATKTKDLLRASRNALRAAPDLLSTSAI